jgi:hypothetical protein
MSNLNDFKNKNTVFTGSDGIIVPTGTTSGPSDGRPAGTVGQLRYNTTVGLAEFYTSTGWTAVDAPPTVTTITGVINASTSSTITINGTNFKNASTVSISGAGVGGIDRALVTTYVNSGQLTAATNATAVNYTGGASYDIKVANPSGLVGTLSGAGTIDRPVAWSTGAGSLGTFYDAGRTVSIQLSAPDPDGNTVTFSTVSGSLPSGLSLSSSGLISGTASAVGTDTTSSFTIRASSQASGGPVTTSDRAFSILVKAPVVQSFTASGTTTSNTSWTSPLTGNISVLVVAGGGSGGAGGGQNGGGGGGGGGVVYHTSYSVSNGSNYTIQVGGGATAGPAQGNNGADSFFNTSGGLLAKGGGGGGYNGGPAANNGGSGGGRGRDGGSNYGTSNQPAITGASVYGNRGGNGPGGGCQSGGGGGGAGGVGQDGQTDCGSGQPSTQSDGGAGIAISITGSSVAYGGGGGGAWEGGSVRPRGGSGNPSGTGGNGPNGFAGGAGNDNVGGGGGAGQGGPTAGRGGCGIVIIKY